MLNLGDVTKINGAEHPIPSVVIGGSPCQDLSVAGKRAGLAGERSGLFMEQIRIIKEMRSCGRTDDDGHILPRFMVWENVPGALSSQGGEDFRAVLEETCRVADETAVIPEPPKGKWTAAGAVVGDGYSVAWRIHDAQYWGVPRRRRRIALVADFGGWDAAKVLFESAGVSGDTEPGGETRQGAAGDAPEGAGEAVSFQERAGKPGGVKGYSSSASASEPCQPSTTKPCYPIEGNGAEAIPIHDKATRYKGGGAGRHDDGGGNGFGIGKDGDPVWSISTAERHSVFALENHPNDSRVKISKDGMFQSLSSRMGTGGNNTPLVMADINMEARCVGNGQTNNISMLEVANPLDTMSVVRRLTPTECERLQGYPDGWTNIGEWTDSKGKRHKEADSPRYKALGNSIALPFWQFLLNRIAAECKEKTMVSLFDGIGGFPLCWQRAGARRSG